MLNKISTLPFSVGGRRVGKECLCERVRRLWKGRDSGVAAREFVLGRDVPMTAALGEHGSEKEGQEEMRPQGSGLIVRDPEATMGTLALSLRQQRREGTARKDEIIDLLKRIVLAALLKWRHIRAGG